MEQRVSRHERSVKHVKPLLPLLAALVHAEQTSLGRNLAAKSKVQFSGFDCSSTRPPVDSIRGSEFHSEASIRALMTAVDQVHALLGGDENGSPTEEVAICLESLVDFLKEMENDAGAQMREECSKVRACV